MVFRLLIREILHRKVNFALGVLAVATATALVVAGWELLARRERLTRDLIDRRRTEVEASGRDLNEAMVQITKRMGFNILITPKGQNLDDPFAPDYASRFMSEESADLLARSNVITINHILPALEQRVEWPERGNRTLFLIGIKGQVPIPGNPSGNAEKRPIQEPVPAGGIVLGDALARREGIAQGDSITIRGENLKVVRIEPRRGDKRDLSGWIELARMQRLAGRAGLINSIWALECTCALADVAKVREEIGRILPGVDVEEMGEKALARAEARKKAAEAAEGALRAEEKNGAELFAVGDRFRLYAVPFVLGGAAVLIGLLAAANVRERRSEIGILRALGVGSGSIAALFLGRAAIVGAAGAFIGSLVGLAMNSLIALSSRMGVEMALVVTAKSLPLLLLDPRILAGTFAVAPLLSAVACWLPTLAAVRQDPAEVLRET